MFLYSQQILIEFCFPLILVVVFHILSLHNYFNCFQWYSWGKIVGGSLEGPGSYIIGYLFYVMWALVFGLLAAMLVRMFAPYACGSGIPEVSFSLL